MCRLLSGQNVRNTEKLNGFNTFQFPCHAPVSVNHATGIMQVAVRQIYTDYTLLF